jgi:8-oxo-dGTP diphosphatase
MIGFILSLTAVILFMVFAPFGIAYQVITDLRGLNKYFFDIAVCIDQAGNVVCRKLLNLVMIKSGGHRFGNPDETISSVIGKNRESSHLTWCGFGLYYLLNKIEKNHSEKAVEEDEQAGPERKNASTPSK